MTPARDPLVEQCRRHAERLRSLDGDPSVKAQALLQWAVDAGASGTIARRAVEDSDNRHLYAIEELLVQGRSVCLYSLAPEALLRQRLGLGPDVVLYPGWKETTPAAVDEFLSKLQTYQGAMAAWDLEDAMEVDTETVRRARRAWRI